MGRHSVESFQSDDAGSHPAQHDSSTHEGLASTVDMPEPALFGDPSLVLYGGRGQVA